MRYYKETCGSCITPKKILVQNATYRIVAHKPFVLGPER